VAECGDYKVVGWDGTITEEAAPDSECGGSSSLNLDTSQTSELNMAPNGAGGCHVSGSLHVVQADALCGQWSGLWICSGDVDAGGNISLDCTCLTTMVGSGVAGTFEGNTYSGDWEFAAQGTDDSGNPVTDTGIGNFLLNRVSASQSVIKPLIPIPAPRIGHRGFRLRQ
jgi:hypothetical protein